MEHLPGPVEHLGALMARMRARRGWSQGDLAAALTARGIEVTGSAVNRWERGNRTMSIVQIGAVLDVCEATPEERDLALRLPVTPADSAASAPDAA